MVQQTKQIVKFFDSINQVQDAIADKDVFIFLDYDGTLTPIVATPDLALLPDTMRDLVRSLSTAYSVSVVSGRATDDVRGKVQVDNIFYAGSHGFEIVEPSGKVTVNQEAREIKKTIDEVHAALQNRLKDVPGALVEHVKYTVSVHYRLVAEDEVFKIKEAVGDVLEKHKNLRKTDGKKVFEIRPNIAWDKGKAVEWILDALGFDEQKNVAVYVGDDTTDEDAFAVLRGKGFGVLVSEKSRASKAAYRVDDTSEVQKLLQWFVDRKKNK